MTTVARDGVPFHVWKIVLKNGNILLNRNVTTCGRFLVVSCGQEEDTAPDWYTIDSIEALKGVEIYRASMGLDSEICMEDILHELFPPIDTQSYRVILSK